MIKTLEYRDDALWLLDQTRLPSETVFVECRDVERVAEAIASLRVRGAPAIGCAAAFGTVVAAQRLRDDGRRGDAFHTGLQNAMERLRAARPTAVNLSWAIERMRLAAQVSVGRSPDIIVEALLSEARAILEEDERSNRAIGAHGAELVGDRANILTHCNAGALAVGAYGTALGVIRAAHEQGKDVHVWVDETRPLLQGARLTAWELQQLGVPYTLITDSMAGHFMARGAVDLVVVGADRIAANGDTANKIGTYSVAVLARAHSIPFVVAAPTSTLDPRTPAGEAIPIEERGAAEVTEFRGVPSAPPGARVANPAFDVTPAHLISAIVTEHGVAVSPYTQALDQLRNARRPGDVTDTSLAASNAI